MSPTVRSALFALLVASLAWARAVQAQPVMAPRAPTGREIEALTQMEREVDGFTDRGRGFRQSLNGLLSRAHDRQLGRLRAGFSRQISTERRLEGAARRRAIDVFLSFLERYPDDREHTPDVMFRLAELYFDEAAYARLDADERLDDEAARRRARGQSTDDLAPAPTDYRCSVLLYRNVISRFGAYRMSDASHYLLGWVLKEMGHEDEAHSAYRSLVCHNRYQYDPAQGFDLDAPISASAPANACPRLFSLLRPRAPELVTPVAHAPAPAVEPTPAVTASADRVMAIPTTYEGCVALAGSTPGQPSRYLGESWYFVGDHHFDEGSEPASALAIAAYQQSMATSVRPRAPSAAHPSDDSAETAASRARFDRNTEYGPFWSKALYKVGWAYFRMQNGYPSALTSFSHLLDYYDFAGAEASAQGNRSDTLRWIGVILSEESWGDPDDSARCQQVVETVSRPPAELGDRSFECAGIMRVSSPYDPERAATLPETEAARRRTPVGGRVPFIPQDRRWTPEAYLELANDYFHENRDYEAVTAYRLFLALYPLHFQAPRVAEGVALAYERQHQFEQAVIARARTGQFTPGTLWWNANLDHPDALRYADALARSSLHDTAILQHQQAARLRTEGLRHASAARALTDRAAQATELTLAAESLRRAREAYNAAVQTYSRFVDAYPNDDAAYEFRYNRGDALYWAQRYEEAARAYGEVRESNENDAHLASAAYMAVKSLEMLVRTEAQSRRLDACVAARAGASAADLVDDREVALLTPAQLAACTSFSAVSVALPASVRALLDARRAYEQRVPRALDAPEALRDVVQLDPQASGNNPPYRPKFAYLNARTLMRFGQTSEAEAAYREVLRAYCDDTVASASFVDLSNLFAAQGRVEERGQLAIAQSNATCRDVDPSGPLSDHAFQVALGVFHRAEGAPAGESAALYEQSARAMEAAVRAHPDHDQAPLATYYAALAYERTGRFDSATQTYARITQRYDSLHDAAGRALSGEDLAQRVNILEQSNFRAAVNYERVFEQDSAVRHYRAVATDARFGAATDHAAHVHDALASIAMIHTHMARWAEARQAWSDFLPHASAGRERAEAEYRRAEVPFRARQWAEAVRSLQDYLRASPSSADAAPYRVQAQYNTAVAWRESGDDGRYRSALREVVTVFRASGQPSGTISAAWAAEGLYRDLDDQVGAFTRNAFVQGTPEQLAAQVTRMNASLREIDTAAQAVVQLRGGEYSIGALTRQGEAHEHLASQEARVAALVLPSPAQAAARQRAQASIVRLRTLAARLNGPAAERLVAQADDLQRQLDDSIASANQQLQARFDAVAADERKLAIINYAVAIYTARASNIPTPFAARALEALRHEENTPLVSDALAHQTVFQYRPGMFDAEAPGQNVTHHEPVATAHLVAR